MRGVTASQLDVEAAGVELLAEPFEVLAPFVERAEGHGGAFRPRL